MKIFVLEKKCPNELFLFRVYLKIGIFEDIPAAKSIPNNKHPMRIKLLFFCPSITILTSWFLTNSDNEYLWPFFVTTFDRIRYRNFTALSVFLSFLWPQLRTPAVAYYLAAWSVAGWSKNGGGTSTLDVEAEWEKRYKLKWGWDY